MNRKELEIKNRKYLEDKTHSEGIFDDESKIVLMVDTYLHSNTLKNGVLVKFETWLYGKDGSIYIGKRIQKEAIVDNEKILSYLKNGRYLGMWRTEEGYLEDYFNGKLKIECRTYTDGEWKWDADIIHYFENYNFKLSDEFINHMKENDWQVPKVPQSIIREMRKKYSLFETEKDIEKHDIKEEKKSRKFMTGYERKNAKISSKIESEIRKGKIIVKEPQNAWAGHCVEKTHIESRIQKNPQQDQDKIVAYLNSGVDTMSFKGIVEDCFDGSEIFGPCFCTDTVWHWDNVLTHYVEKYNYKISNEFYNHMKQNNWKIPEYAQEFVIWDQSKKDKRTTIAN